jgi:hypothetical protein
MARKDSTGGVENGRPMPDIWQRLHQQNFDALNGVLKLGLDGAQTVAERYGNTVYEAHRRFAVLMWRGTPTPEADGDRSSALVVAQRATNTTLAHAAALAEIATKLQLESLAIFERSALASLNLFEPQVRNGHTTRVDAG